MIRLKEIALYEQTLLASPTYHATIFLKQLIFLLLDIFVHTLLYNLFPQINQIPADFIHELPSLNYCSFAGQKCMKFHAPYTEKRTKVAILKLIALIILRFYFETWQDE